MAASIAIILPYLLAYMHNFFVLFQVISAQQLPKPDKEKLSSIVDPLVWVQTYGAPIDNNTKKTHRIDNNGTSEFLFLFLFYSPIVKFGTQRTV